MLLLAMQALHDAERSTPPLPHPHRTQVATLTAHIREEVLAGAGAALLQVWACRDLEEGIVLSTQGLPYFLLGDGDELALFRYMSTKHCFPLGEALGQGTPASVFHNRQVIKRPPKGGGGLLHQQNGLTP